MSKSWGHTVTRLPAHIVRQIAQVDAAQAVGHGVKSQWNQTEQTYDYLDNGEVALDVLAGQSKYFRCSVRCPERIAFVAGYEYVTGRAGRTSRQARAVCAKHAAAFARRYGVAMPT